MERNYGGGAIIYARREGPATTSTLRARVSQGLGWGLGFGVWGLGFGVWGLGFGVWGLGFMVCGLGFMVYGVWFAVYGLRAQGLGFGV